MISQSTASAKHGRQAATREATAAPALRRRRDVLRTAAACAIVVTAAAWLRLPAAGDSMLFIDEPIYYAFAARLALPGAHVYSHTADQKPPAGPVTYRLASSLAPEHPIAAVHAATTISVAVTALLMVGGSTVLLGAPWPGLIAGLLYALCSSSLRGDQAPWFAFSSLEHFQAPWLLAFTFVFTLSLKTQRRGIAGLAGALLGVAGLYKQNVPVLLAAAAAVAAVAALRGTLRVPRAAALAASAAAGTIAVTALPPIYYTVIGHFSDWWYCNVTLLADYRALSASPLHEAGMLAAIVPLAVPLVAGGIYAAVLAVRKGALAAQDALVVLLATGWLALFVSVLPGLHKGHYLVQGLPLECMVIGVALVAGWRGVLGARGTRRLVLGAVLAAVLVVPLGAEGIELWRGRAELARIAAQDFYLQPHRRAGTLTAVVDFVATHTGPDDLIYVHSEAPEFYVLTRRTPAVNDPVGSWIANYPTPRNAGILLEQLRRTPPRVIVELAYRRYGREDETLDKWPELWSWIGRHYRTGLSTANLRILVLRPDASAR
jgi:hypothetical protein